MLVMIVWLLEPGMTLFSWNRLLFECVSEIPGRFASINVAHNAITVNNSHLTVTAFLSGVFLFNVLKYHLA